MVDRGKPFSGRLSVRLCACSSGACVCYGGCLWFVAPFHSRFVGRKADVVGSDLGRCAGFNYPLSSLGYLCHILLNAADLVDVVGSSEVVIVAGVGVWGFTLCGRVGVDLISGSTE